MRLGKWLELETSPEIIRDGVLKPDGKQTQSEQIQGTRGPSWGKRQDQTRLLRGLQELVGTPGAAPSQDPSSGEQGHQARDMISTVVT